MKPKTILMIVGAAAIFVAAGAYVDHRMNMDSSLTGLQTTGTPSAGGLENYGPAPEFTGITNWLNSSPLTLAQLKGKVVLIDFWTYSCINCIRTLPYVTKWYDTYKDQGLVVVGVHTPEFAFEKDSSNVADAIKRFGITYPVAQDNDYGTWQAYSNQYWPAEYLIDQQGNVVHVQFGEGDYDVTENAIRQLLGMSADAKPDNGPDLTGIQSPEMYFGSQRLQNLADGQAASATAKKYTLPKDVALNTFAVGGTWQFNPDQASLVSGTGTIRLKFHSSKVYMVASSQHPATLTITVDGKAQPPVTVTTSQLYTLFDADTSAEHTIEITTDTPGFQAFTFTFG